MLPTLLLALSLAPAQPPLDKKEDKPLPISAMRPRLLGPAVTSGRVVGFAVNPNDRSHYYVAAGSGGVWKTTNAGITWTPIFDNEGSYSIGCIVLDPKNPGVLWVGTGENNSQRSVGYGDGVYKSTDGGKTWANVGLKTSEHIGKIVIDPRDSDTVYVAAQGPLWTSGGERGLYKTTDGGKTWNRVLNIDENTGVTDLVLDPRNPDLLIAASYQRQRHVWTIIDGGPGSAIHRSTDGGKTWKKITSGLPAGDLGRIGLAAAPTDPDTIYAIVEAAEGGGIHRSQDRGITWEKRNPFAAQAQYYSHLVVDPTNKDHIFAMGVAIQVSEDGGKTLTSMPQQSKHVDNHELWIDPKNPDYYLCGCDGGIYESFDRSANWQMKSNLPITQFYDIACDESGPFYNVYGGTQDNFTLGGPARSRSVHGIMNQDWFVVQGGDGFHCKVEPGNPDIVYGCLQYGVLARYDRKTGERVQIQPQPGVNQPPLRWNWDSPLAVSAKHPQRLYFAANILFQSDDRGDSWKAISPDLTRQIDRNKLPIMGKVWGPDAVFKNGSTSLFGNSVALAESPLKDGALCVGTDDGLIQVTEDGGKNWTKLGQFPGVPAGTYVSKLVASQHDAGTLYACFDNHKEGDFAPYLLKSANLGKTWTSIAGDLPTRGTVYCLAEDHIDPNLLFVGTEFGLFATFDGGGKWRRIKNGLPTIQVKDLCIQKKMNDLVIGTFGRGIYVLDDYSPLRKLSAAMKSQEAVLFPIRDALLHIPTMQYGGRGKAYQGAAFYEADNPPFGAVFTYFLKEGLKTRKQLRKEAEKKAEKEGKFFPYPTAEELLQEDEEEAPTVFLVVKDAEGNVVRTIFGPTGEGMQKAVWDLRDPGATLPSPAAIRASDDDDEGPPRGSGPLVAPGKHTATLYKRARGALSRLSEPVEFSVVLDTPGNANVEEVKAQVAFHRQVLKLQRAVAGSTNVANELATRLDQIRRALDVAPNADEAAKTKVRAMIETNREILRALRGNTTLAARNENVPLSIVDRVQYAARSAVGTLGKPTGTQKESYEIAVKVFGPELTKLKQLSEVEVPTLEKQLDLLGAPWTTGRLPNWDGGK